MSTTWIVITIILAIIAILVIWFITSYNGLISRRNQTDEGLSRISIQLQRRFDLIPNLVETVKGYASHEKETLQKITDARAATAKALKTGEIKDITEADRELHSSLVSLNAVAENYPDLKASNNFRDLQESLETTENKVAGARNYYNSSVLSYNNKVMTFPNNIIASMFHFAKREMFEEESPEVRVAPKVSFS